jgi:hypothetical protein
MMCEYCMGRGWIETSQAHPWGSTVAYERLLEMCVCLENGICPECGEDLDPPSERCEKCGWKDETK